MNQTSPSYDEAIRVNSIIRKGTDEERMALRQTYHEVASSMQNWFSGSVDDETMVKAAAKMASYRIKVSEIAHRNP